MNGYQQDQGYVQDQGYGQNQSYGYQGYQEHKLDEDAFGPSKGGIVSSFDAFPKTKKTYLVQGRNSSAWTVTLILTCVWLAWTETARWFAGTTTQTFSVEKGVSHDMQINLDIIVGMRCADLHVNMQDAAGDRTLAGDLLRKDPTSWAQWTGKNAEKGVHELNAGEIGGGWDMDDLEVHNHLNVKQKKKFGKTPRVKGATDACRIFGSLDGNKVQGDFHITARGHGYMEFGEHLDHASFNFSHIIREMSFGPYFPSMNNPLDNTIALTPTPQDHFYKFQYYLSIVPTIYTDSLKAMRALDSADSAATAGLFANHAIKTNQYAVTSQSHTVPEQSVPGIFVKFDIEPITLSLVEQSGGFWPLVVRLVNVISGVMVAGGWAWQMYDLALEFWGKRGMGRRGDGMGVLGTPAMEKKSWD